MGTRTMRWYRRRYIFVCASSMGAKAAMTRRSSAMRFCQRFGTRYCRLLSSCQFSISSAFCGVWPRSGSFFT